MKIESGLKYDMLLGLCCLPAIVIIFIAGFLFDWQHQASIMASGALPLAFGASKTWEGSSFSLLAATAFGLAISSWLGGLVGNFMPVYIAGAMLYAALYAVITGLDNTAGWVFLQSSIAYLISGYFPGSFLQAGTRAALTFSGALLQLIIICLILSGMTFRLEYLSRLSWLTYLRRETRKYRHKIHLRWSVFFALLAMGFALSVVELSQLKNGYWTGMTLLLCLRNHYRDSLLRVPARILGTLLGCLAAGALGHWLQQPLLMAGGFIISGYIAFILSWRLDSGSYLVFTFFVTIMVVFMLSLTGLSQAIVVTDRLMATAVGGGFALGAILLTRLVTSLQAKLTGNKEAKPGSSFLRQG
ncbi:FUSC family protein [Pantoea sp.]|uniref:FUSC family protein n=1 Tax=Pantoea sp. TaxID=69393 RepID=UPI0028A0F9DD|nr:FUSC family protein [Pantoea sp.]